MTPLDDDDDDLGLVPTDGEEERGRCTHGTEDGCLHRVCECGETCRSHELEGACGWFREVV